MGYQNVTIRVACKNKTLPEQSYDRYTQLYDEAKTRDPRALWHEYNSIAMATILSARHVLFRRWICRTEAGGSLPLCGGDDQAESRRERRN